MKCETPSWSMQFFFNGPTLPHRLHWWVWDHWRPQSRKNRRQSHRQTEQGKCLCFKLVQMVQFVQKIIGQLDFIQAFDSSWSQFSQCKIDLLTFCMWTWTLCDSRLLPTVWCDQPTFWSPAQGPGEVAEQLVALKAVWVRQLKINILDFML